MTHVYVEISEELAAQYDGQRDGADVFKATQTADGRFVVSMNAVNAYEFLKDIEITPVKLEVEDFPAEPPPIQFSELVQAKAIKRREVELEAKKLALDLQKYHADELDKLTDVAEVEAYDVKEKGKSALSDIAAEAIP